MRELRALVGTRSRWPALETFLDAGRFRLHEQVMLQGGERWWADQLGLRLRKSCARRSSWDEERIRGTLSTYLADKTSWPTRRQFEADGMRGVRVAINRTGGIDRWIHEFALPRQHRHNGHTGYWTEQRIRTELTAFCDGRTVFPSRTEFKRAGLAGMFCALKKHNGPDWWARELALPRYRRGSGLATQRSRTATKSRRPGRDSTEPTATTRPA